MTKDGLRHHIVEGIHDMCYIWVQEVKNLVKDEGVLIFCLLVPIFYPLLYSWAYNNEVVRNVPVAVVDMSHSQNSRHFIRMTDASADVRVAYYSNSLEEAKQLMGEQKVHGILFFPQDFDTKINRMEQVAVSVYCDMSLMLAYKAVFQTATAVASKMGSQIQVALSNHSTTREDEVAVQPLAFEEVPIFNTTGGYGNFILPGVLMLIIQQTLMLGIGMSAGTARERNQYQTLIPTSLHYNGIFRIVLGKSLCYFLLYAVQAAYLTMVIPCLFHFVHMPEWHALLALMVPYILACTFFSMTLSTMVRYRENVMLLVVFTSVPLLFLAGMSWPQSSIPGFWQGVSWLFPSTFGIRGFVRLNTMGASLGDIRPEYSVLWIQTLVYFLTACIAYYSQIIRARRMLLNQKGAS